MRCLVDNLMCKLFSFNNILLLLYCRFKFEVLDKMEFMNKIEFEMILCMLNIYIKIYIFQLRVSLIKVWIFYMFEKKSL